MVHPRRACFTLSAGTLSRRSLTLAALVFVLGTGATFAQREENRKPSVALRVNPPVGFTPLRVRVEVDLRGGADDFQEFYCPSIEWDWADGTVSETGDDCDPYEAGKSKIRRRYTTTYTFRQAGEYKVYFRMKQKSKVVGAANATVQVRAGVRDFDDQ
jgi:hypothetical protein